MQKNIWRAYSNDGCVDAKETNTFEEAKAELMKLIKEWVYDWDTNWDEIIELIDDSMLCVEEYDVSEDEWFTFWKPSEKDLKEIGYKVKDSMKKCVFIDANRNGYGPDQCGETMTVKELCEYLMNNFDDNAEVFLMNDRGYTYGSINENDFHTGRYDEDNVECDWDGYRYD